MELLRTSRLLLRDWSDSDEPAFIAVYSQWDVVRWLGPKPRTVVTDRAGMDRRRAAWAARLSGHDAPFGFWAIVPLGDEQSAPIGTALLSPLSEAGRLTGEVEIGWHLHPDAQGRGLATEAAAALLAAARRQGASRVLAVMEPDNAASRAVALRLGMQDEGLTGRWFGLETRQFAWHG